MADLQLNKSLPSDQSFDKVIKNLRQWYINIVSQVNEMYDNILTDIDTTYDEVHYFASFTNALLIEHENQLEKATTNEEIDILQDRIDQIITEVQLLQSLSFRLNCNSVKLNGQIRINYNNKEINSDFSLTDFQYRFLITRNDAIELKKYSLPIFRLTSYDNELINECVLTFNVHNLDSFSNAFTSYWNIFPNHNEIRMLIPQSNISFIMGKLGETSRLLIKRFQLDKIKTFVNVCPKSDEKILLINGKRQNLIKDCIEEIYFNIEEQNKKEFNKQNIRLYNPGYLSTEDIEEIIISNIDYGGFIQNRSTTHHSKLHETEDEEDTDEDDDDLWDENDEWWNCQNTKDNSSEAIQREMLISNMHAGVIIGVNASRIDRIKQKTGAYLYINGEASDLKRTVFIKGTREQVDRAYACIENLLERFKNDKLPIKQRRSHTKRKGK